MSRAASSPTEIRTDTRDKILLAALDLFTEKGFDAATTREIAARVGVNHGLIPYYFGSKLKLWRAAVDRAFEELQSEIEAMGAGPGTTDPRERAARMIRAHVYFVARHPEFVRLMYEEGKRRGERMRWIVDRHVKPLYEAVAAVNARMASSAQNGGAGVPTDISPVHFFYVMAGASGLIFHQAEECRRVSGVDPFDPDIVETHARYVERILLGRSPNGREEETAS